MICGCQAKHSYTISSSYNNRHNAIVSLKRNQAMKLASPSQMRLHSNLTCAEQENVINILFIIFSCNIANDLMIGTIQEQKTLVLTELSDSFPGRWQRS